MCLYSCSNCTEDSLRCLAAEGDEHCIMECQLFVLAGAEDATFVRFWL